MMWEWSGDFCFSYYDTYGHVVVTKYDVRFNFSGLPQVLNFGIAKIMTEKSLNYVPGPYETLIDG